MTRVVAASGSPFEAQIGFARAVRMDRFVAVSGTAPIADDGSPYAPGDAYRQTLRCLEIAMAAAEKLGADTSMVLRTRVFLTDTEVWQDVARGHAEVFGAHPPASTFVTVAGLLNPEWLVEIEVDCLLPDAF